MPAANFLPFPSARAVVMRRLTAEADALMRAAAGYEQQQKFNLAERNYRKLIELQPDNAFAYNSLGRLLHAKGKPAQAAGAFAHALALMPQLLEQHYDAMCATLLSLSPELARAVAQSSPGSAPVEPTPFAGNPLLLQMLRAAPIRHLGLERVLTATRAWLVGKVDDGVDDERLIAFAGALAAQCFINEYVFAVGTEEETVVVQLSRRAADALASGRRLPPLIWAVLAAYAPLADLPGATALATMTLPPALRPVIEQQVVEPERERALRAEILQLTPISGAVSEQVRAQYEANPYPRWVAPPAQVEPVSVAQYVAEAVSANLPRPPHEPLEVLVAGCGTGWHAIALAQRLEGTSVLAVDLSRASLAYAKLRTPAELSQRLTFAQADIETIDGIGRSFDLIDASGVLHHTADTFASWRKLLALLRPDGLMHIGLYSERARGEIAAAQDYLRRQGYSATAADIRRCRGDLLANGFADLAKTSDFYTTSECRDLLFHVQEHRVAIPAIDAFLAAENLEFLGFEFPPAAKSGLRRTFEGSGWSWRDLARWHALEIQNPALFSAMYHFWVRKPA
jgi:SAM-dependent methyltransferase